MTAVFFERLTRFIARNLGDSISLKPRMTMMIAGSVAPGSSAPPDDGSNTPTWPPRAGPRPANHLHQTVDQDRGAASSDNSLSRPCSRLARSIETGEGPDDHYIGREKSEP